MTTLHVFAFTYRPHRPSVIQTSCFAT